MEAAGQSTQKAESIFPIIRELETLGNFRSLIEQLSHESGTT